MANTPTPASVASRLTDEEIEHLAQAAEQEIQFWEAADAAAAVLRDYVRLRKLENNVKEIMKEKDAVDARVKDGFIVTALGAVEQIKRLLAEAEKGEAK